jgi:hypothetical protein
MKTLRNNVKVHKQNKLINQALKVCDND